MSTENSQTQSGQADAVCSGILLASGWGVILLGFIAAIMTVIAATTGGFEESF
jgi:hypothetical protein